MGDIDNGGGPLVYSVYQYQNYGHQSRWFSFTLGLVLGSMITLFGVVLVLIIMT